MSSDFDEFFDGPKKDAPPKQETVQKPAEVAPAPQAVVPPSPSTESAPAAEVVQATVTTPSQPSGFGRATYAEKMEQGPPTDFMPEETGKEVYLIYGEKNDGKTFAALSLPGPILALSFDYKTAIVKKRSYNNDPRITVYDALIKEQYGSPEAELQSSRTTLDYINEILDKAKANPPDWVLIDGSEIFQKVAENLMRANNNLGPFAGVQWTFWKERRFYIRQLHEKAIRLAKRGVVYTTYVDKDEIVVEGQVKARTDVPKWIDAVLYSVDEVIRVYISTVGTERRYMARIDGSKLRPQNSGKIFDITGKGVRDLVSK